MLRDLAKIFHKRWYWDHVQPEVIIWQDNRQLGFALDIRNFFVNPKCQELQEIVKNRRFAYHILSWVNECIKSKPDKTEFWQLPFETLAKRTGDCEDKAILLANLLRASGIEDWRVRLNVGMTSAGAHAWVSYFDGQNWVSLDFISCRYEEVWFSWHAQKAFTKKENIKE